MRDFKELELKLVAFLRDYCKNIGVENLLIGMSGGLDSAIVGALCAKAMPQNTHALIMPTKNSDPKNIKDATEFCQKRNIKFKILSIESILGAYQESIDTNLNNIRKGNLSARIRMSLLYDYSADIRAIVVGTSNKSELMLGYGTIFGDMACAINPIGELYKTEIFEFARYLEIDENIINKAPSADLWEGQSDEEDIGYSYEVVDEILIATKNGEIHNKQIEEKFGKKTVQEILKRVKSNEFKRRMPLIAKI